MEVSRGWEEGEWEVIFSACRVSVWEDEKVLEMDGGDGYTTTWMHLMPLKYTLKNGQNGKLYIMYIYRKKKVPSMTHIYADNFKISFLRRGPESD